MDEKKQEKLFNVALRGNARTPEPWAERTRTLAAQNRTHTSKRCAGRRLIVLLLILVLAVPAGVYAAFRLLSPADAALLMEREELAKVFDKETTDIVTKTDGDYTVSLLGMVSGGQLDAFDLNAEDAAKRNYVALAVQRSDGKPIEDYDKPGISVSPLIEGFDPMRWNAAAFDNRWEKQIVDGVLYCIADWTDIEMFGYRKMYIAVMEDSFLPSRALFHYSEKTGSISENKDYEKVNLLFEIEADQNKVNQKAAEKWIAEKEARRQGDDANDDTLLLEVDSVKKQGVTFMIKDEMGVVTEGESEYPINIFLKGDGIKSVQLTASAGKLLEAEKITKKEYERLKAEMNNKDSRRHMGLDSSEGIYQAWHYENAAKTIQINHSLLTEKMYPEETLRGIAELQKMKNLEIEITVIKKNGKRVSVIAEMTAVNYGDAMDVFRFKFK